MSPVPGQQILAPDLTIAVQPAQPKPFGPRPAERRRPDGDDGAGRELRDRVERAGSPASTSAADRDRRNRRWASELIAWFMAARPRRSAGRRGGGSGEMPGTPR